MKGSVVALEKLRRLSWMAEDRWGDVPMSSKMLFHENGEYSIRVFHTFDLTVDGKPGRVALKYSSNADVVVEQVYHVETEEFSNFVETEEFSIYTEEIER